MYMGVADDASVAAASARIPPTSCNNADVGHAGATERRRKGGRAGAYEAGCRHGVGCNGSEGFEPSMQGEMRHAAQLNAGLLNRAVITRNECAAALQFACDLLFDSNKFKPASRMQFS